jgi:hypothetical protein
MSQMTIDLLIFERSGRISSHNGSNKILMINHMTGYFLTLEIA